MLNLPWEMAVTQYFLFTKVNKPFTAVKGPCVTPTNVFLTTIHRPDHDLMQLLKT